LDQRQPANHPHLFDQENVHGISLQQGKNVTSTSPPRVSIPEVIWSWIGSFLGLAAVGPVHFNFLPDSDMVMIIGSF
jgi:hypothetical protein